jgi:hypothetical protein
MRSSWALLPGNPIEALPSPKPLNGSCHRTPPLRRSTQAISPADGSPRLATAAGGALARVAVSVAFRRWRSPARQRRVRRHRGLRYRRAAGPLSAKHIFLAKIAPP